MGVSGRQYYQHLVEVRPSRRRAGEAGKRTTRRGTRRRRRPPTRVTSRSAAMRTRHRDPGRCTATMAGGRAHRQDRDKRAGPYSDVALEVHETGDVLAPARLTRGLLFVRLHAAPKSYGVSGRRRDRVGDLASGDAGTVARDGLLDLRDLDGVGLEPVARERALLR